MKEDGWITKAEAAALLSVDERTIERRARAGRIQARMKPGFPTLYRAADVEILVQAGSGEVSTGLLARGPAGNGNGHSGALTIERQAVVNPVVNPLAPEDAIRQLAAAFRALQYVPIGPTGPTDAPTGPTGAYVSKAEALAIAGVSDHELRKAVTAGEVKRRGRRYRRTDLEAL